MGLRRSLKTLFTLVHSVQPQCERAFLKKGEKRKSYSPDGCGLWKLMGIDALPALRKCWNCVKLRIKIGLARLFYWKLASPGRMITAELRRLCIFVSRLLITSCKNCGSSRKRGYVHHFASVLRGTK